mgnify:CR=1 FL=1
MKLVNILSVTKNNFPKNLKLNKDILSIQLSENNHQSNVKIKWLRDHC